MCEFINNLYSSEKWGRMNRKTYIGSNKNDLLLDSIILVLSVYVHWYKTQCNFSFILIYCSLQKGNRSVMLQQQQQQQQQPHQQQQHLHIQQHQKHQHQDLPIPYQKQQVSFFLRQIKLGLKFVKFHEFFFCSICLYYTTKNDSCCCNIIIKYHNNNSNGC